MPDLIQGQKVFINVAAGGRLVLKSRTTGDSTVITVLEGGGFKPGTIFSHVGVREYIFPEAGQVSIESILGSCNYEGFDLLEAQSSGGDPLRASPDGQGGFTLRLPDGRSAALLTDANISSARLVTALKKNRATDRINSEREAAHFLRQCTFGPLYSEIQACATLGSRTAWVRQQFALNFAKRFMDRLYEDYGQTALNVSNQISNIGLITNWQFIQDPAQLRARCLYALHKMFPVSTTGGAFQAPGGYAPLGWMDRLNGHVFGNYVDLLESITYSIEMSRMLTYYANEKGSADGTRQPDENYAREIMQLFTIGLYELNPDGTRKLDALGQPIATYSNSDIQQMARVFTGLTRDNLSANQYELGADLTSGARTNWVLNYSNLDLGTKYYADPQFRMKHALWAYEWGAKVALGGRINIPADTDPITNIRMVCEQLVAHPSCAPFVAKRFIQMLVKSNPSPEYVARVASAFENNGRGVRGDMKALWMAILTDPEASLAGSMDEFAGRVLDGYEAQMMHVRSFVRANPDGRVAWFFGTPADLSDFGAAWWMYFPSIFGPYDANYTESLAAQYGLEAPEMGVWDPGRIVTSTTRLVDTMTVQAEPRDTTSANKNKAANYNMLPVTGTAAELVERINLLLCGGQMSPELRTICETLAAQINPSTAALQEDRVLAVLQPVMASPDYRVQL